MCEWLDWRGCYRETMDVEDEIEEELWFPANWWEHLKYRINMSRFGARFAGIAYGLTGAIHYPFRQDKVKNDQVLLLR